MVWLETSSIHPHLPPPPLNNPLLRHHPRDLQAVESCWLTAWQAGIIVDIINLIVIDCRFDFLNIKLFDS